MLTGQGQDRLGQRVFIHPLRRPVTLRPTPLLQHLTGVWCETERFIRVEITFKPKVYLPVAFATEGNEVLAGIVAQQTPRTGVMYLKIVRAAAILAASPISLQYLSAQLTIGMRIEPKSRPFGSQGVHDAVCTSARNSAFSG